MGPPIAERPGIARIPKHFKDPIVGQRNPVDLPYMWTGTDTARKEQPLFPKGLHGCPSRPGSFESCKQYPNGLPDLDVRIKNDFLVFSVNKPNRKRELKCRTPSLVEDTS